ncbi:hypothetical protein halTADL_1266 [Halohasta litchfieldiae]|jgi:hypothetical protein|uniref:Uncharacterized protein n=1 Tax=Halohasta litchfieldiae TaxID=1073996 RepID=A0A1H6VIR6_9EURY|nr:hypothetical protein [Halohasta litchfieldiae]ATW88049.1 hypothetical protein halTADL_1266 [Halohasta litchfieldiae]SEJ03576.1 hypothetical protein SAMN05444271_11737 [Halohasta litchfieldiae]
MSLLRSHPYAATLVLLVFGVVLILSFVALGATVSDPTYSMEPFDPNNNVEPLRYTPEVRQFNADTQPTAHADAVNTAIETGGFTGQLDGDLSHIDGEGFSYLIVDQAVYEYHSESTGDEVTITMNPIDAETVAHEVATPYEDASTTTREAIDTGEPVTGKIESGWIVIDDGTYYSAEFVESGVIVSQFIVRPVGALLISVGGAFTAAGLWLLQSFIRGETRPLSEKSAAGVALASGGVTLGAITLFRSGTSVLITPNSIVLAIATGVLPLIGVLLARERYLRIGVILVAIPIFLTLWTIPTFLTSGVNSGILSAGFALFGLLLVGVIGSPLIVYGYRFTPS